MSKSAPNTRLINALTGEKAPAEFFKALSEADSFCKELDELHELRTRVAELESALELAEAECDGYRQSAKDLSTVLESAFADINAVRAERDNLASDLADLREAHMVTVGKLATANAAVARYERGGW